MKATKVTVANALVRSSATTAAANSHSDLPVHASTANSRLVRAMAMPDRNMARTSPIRTANSPPSTVNATVVTQPSPLE